MTLFFHNFTLYSRLSIQQGFEKIKLGCVAHNSHSKKNGPKNSELQTYYYSGKKKKHTIKIQLIVDEKSKKIVSVAFDAGSVHDFLLFKNTTKDLNNLISFLADSGYQGITSIFKNSMIPKKKSKYNPLTDQDKELNKLISSIRITIEHVNCQLKIFRILSERYRSRIKTFYKRAILICYFYNYCL